MIQAKQNASHYLVPWRYPNEKTYQHQLEFVNTMLDMLETYRIKVRDMEIKEKRYGIFLNMPVGYEG